MTRHQVGLAKRFLAFGRSDSFSVGVTIDSSPSDADFLLEFGEELWVPYDAATTQPNARSPPRSAA